MELKAEIKGLEKLQRKMMQVVRDLRGSPMLQAMGEATLLIQSHGRMNAPVDTGRLRASITPQVLQRDAVLTGVVGSQVFYAPYQEFGTYQDDSTRRGVKPKWYLRRALEEAKDRIQAIFARALRLIVER
jgi:HK97 gp10 family phage protein